MVKLSFKVDGSKYFVGFLNFYYHFIFLISSSGLLFKKIFLLLVWSIFDFSMNMEVKIYSLFAVHYFMAGEIPWRHFSVHFSFYSHSVDFTSDIVIFFKRTCCLIFMPNLSILGMIHFVIIKIFLLFTLLSKNKVEILSCFYIFTFTSRVYLYATFQHFSCTVIHLSLV
jgi:hypothetical protein